MRLVRQYFDNTGLLFPYIHRDSFINTYQKLASSNFKNVRRSWLGMLNMILALSINCCYPSDLSQRQRRVESNVFVLRAMALCEKQIRSKASLEIGSSRAYYLRLFPVAVSPCRLLAVSFLVQFLLLLSHYLQGTESSIQTWNVHGLAVKASYQLGLHSKHALDRYEPLEREVRVRTWYTCVLLDRYLQSGPQSIQRLAY